MTPNVITRCFVLAILPLVVAKFGMFPGTKWCGPGDIAQSYDDLGERKKIDMCCRTHDHCPRNIHKGETKWGIHNSGNFTWSDCQCDKNLHNCLKHAKDFFADTIGSIYFDFVKNKKCVGFPQNGSAPHLVHKPKYRSDVSSVMKDVLDMIIG